MATDLKTDSKTDANAMQTSCHGPHRHWKTWENGKAFSSQGKFREFCQDWKSQGILLKILEKSDKITLEN